MPDYTSKSYQLKDDHTWKASPGYTVIVLDRGAVRFEYPNDWVVGVEDGHISIRDLEKPRDNCDLSVSFWRIPPGAEGALPLEEILRASMNKGQDDIETGQPQNYYRDGINAIWVEKRYYDEAEPGAGKREAYNRILIAASFGVVCLVTFAYWTDHADRFRPVWEKMLASLVLGETITDPTRGPVTH